MKFKLLICIPVLTLSFASCGIFKNITNKSDTTPQQTVTAPISSPVKSSRVTNLSYDKRVQDYVETYSGVAMREMRNYKIPASVTLAQGILESGTGQSTLALRSNNHFGIKCHKDWTGRSVKHDDDRPQECFRKYKHPEASYEDHSKFLTTRRRYASLFKLPEDDYKNWAIGLKLAGYATDPKYSDKLIRLIDTYKLYDFDRFVLGKGVAPIQEEGVNNIERDSIAKLDAQMMAKKKIIESLEIEIADKKDYLERLTQKTQKQEYVIEQQLTGSTEETKDKAVDTISSMDINKVNVLKQGIPTDKTPKRIEPSTTQTIHKVEKGETLYAISKKYGIPINRIMSMNGLKNFAISIGQELIINSHESSQK